jgi:hypothetical protein
MHISLRAALWSAFALAAMPGPPAFAVEYPFNFFREQNIDTHQVGHVRVNIDPQGNGSLEDFWSNGKQISGNNFYAIVVLVGKNKEVIWSNKQEKGLDASYGHHAREGAVTTKFALNKEQMEALDHVEFKLGVVNCGTQIAEFHCCNKGIDISFSPKKCEVPALPRGERPMRRIQ